MRSIRRFPKLVGEVAKGLPKWPGAGRRSSSALPGFVDTHCHLDMVLPRLARQARSDARKAGGPGQGTTSPNNFAEWRSSLEGSHRGFEGCVTIACSTKSFGPTADLLFNEGVYGSFGIHPLNAHEWNEAVEEKLLSVAKLPKVVAWGECGLDYYDKKTGQETSSEEYRKRQRRVFARQMQLAAELGKPLVVHTRSAEADTVDLMSKFWPSSMPVHVHCFTSSWAMAEELLARFPALYLGFTGVVTFKDSAAVQSVVANTPLERILLETDSPYMAPIPFRGRIAHPGHVAEVAEGIAAAKGLPLEDVLLACRENARQMYGI